MEYDEGNEYSVLSIYPFHRGFGFAVLDSERGLVDWGVSRVSAGRKDEELVARLEGLFEWHNPSAVAVENTAETLRGSSAKDLTQKVIGWAFSHRLRVIPISQTDLRGLFSGSGDQHSIATQIARSLPELEPRLPGRRRAWESVDERMFLFNAVGIGLAAMNSLAETP
jgi:hypothetical protein